jgi:hypothetical protein
LKSKYKEIASIEAGERHPLLFFFTPTPTQHPKRVQKGFDEEKKKIKTGVEF